jgi:hypothetical protein
MMNKKSLLALEIAWIIIGILCTGAAAHNRIVLDGDKFVILLLMGIASFVMAWFRHNQRKNN